MSKIKSFWVAYFLVVGLALPAFSQQRSSQGGKYDQQTTIAETQAKSVSGVFSVDDKLVVANQQPK